ncbi:MAG: FCD domain-containing protein [Micrococcaceae bacterium]|uniref:FadR/GntR family transcriptional regulator n=1 Tax=unclassified Arthrobacter TaxID=235627 RepID=UPI00265622F8|nr:FCD domain-containing protein [Micrococcaceae bacterium]MDN5823840.1 FCD domain-containing protein [Micrococcaceae bacterium]MDN5878396.1 FCD domain-containing protein [Micrococcaceae bacterium]MDN5887495.1 FCD domain-containing protein [Micrococcaceae bacterium]MDN6299463.1 FCD domain-containing protein [Micrococcaceae bacterium]
MTTENQAGAPAPKAYQTVLDAIENQLRHGQLKVGDQLPGERLLAETHGISRASVRDAIRILDVMGVVRTATGSGPGAGAVVISEPATGIATALRMHVASARLSVEEIVQTRILLETWAANTADLQADPERSDRLLAAARELLDAMDDPQLDRAGFHAMDARFHVLLSGLAGNAVIEAMMESLRLSIGDYVRESVRSDAAWEPIAEVLRAQHHGILAAVSAGHGAEAARLLREHIEWFHQESTETQGD